MGRAPAADEVETVEIGLLCYHGRAALERAAAVRQQLADELERNGGSRRFSHCSRNCSTSCRSR
jgi:hypothetical protein